MMRQVLLVDDEVKIVQWLAKAVPWSEYGFEVSEICSGGLQAITYLENHPIDLVITDIRMPGLDGLHLIKKLHETNTSIQTIILSGFNQFEYAQQALKYGVRGFLLKPIIMEELTELLSIISKETTEENNTDTLNSSAFASDLKVSDKKIYSVIEYVEKNYNKELCLKNTADFFAFHPAYLGKLFKEATGESFNGYLHKHRIKQLKKLLVQTNLPINQLLESVGYHNYEYFYTIFKKYEGISFSEYRSSHMALD